MDPKITAAITAVGAYVPEYRLTNAELETMVDTGSCFYPFIAGNYHCYKFRVG